MYEQTHFRLDGSDKEIDRQERVYRKCVWIEKEWRAVGKGNYDMNNLTPGRRLL